MLQYIYYFNKILCHYMYSHRILFVHPYHIDNIVKCSIQCNVQRDIRIPRWSYVCVVSVNHTFNKSVFMNSREIPCLEWNICSVSVISDGKKNLKKTPKKPIYLNIRTAWQFLDYYLMKCCRHLDSCRNIYLLVSDLAMLLVNIE